MNLGASVEVTMTLKILQDDDICNKHLYLLWKIILFIFYTPHPFLFHRSHTAIITFCYYNDIPWSQMIHTIIWFPLWFQNSQWQWILGIKCLVQEGQWSQPITQNIELENNWGYKLTNLTHQWHISLTHALHTESSITS